MYCLILALLFLDDELVLGRAAGVLAGPDDERAVGRDEALAVADGVLVQLGGGQVGADGTAEGGALGRRGGGHLRWTPWRRRSRLIDRPRVMRPERLAGVGFRSRVGAMLPRCGMVA